MPEIPNVVDEQLIESAWGNAIRDRTVQRYADAAERDSLHPSPLGGDLAYLEDPAAVQVWDGGLWRPLAAPLWVRRARSSDQNFGDSSQSKVAWNQETLLDPGGWITYTGGADEPGGRIFTVADAGRYRVSASSLWASNSTGVRSLTVHINESSSPVARGEVTARGTVSPFVAWVGPLAAGNIIDIRGFQSSGSTLALLANAATWVLIERLT